MYYLLFIVIAFIVDVFIDIQTWNKWKGASGWLFIICLISPIIYEFKPLPWIGDKPQYEIIRNSNGKVVGLTPNSTGFHWPFMSKLRFVNLSDFGGFFQTAVYNSGKDGTLEVAYSVTCKDPKRLFIESNGAVSRYDWFGEGFSKFLNSGHVVESEKENKKSLSLAEFRELVGKRAEEWNRTNSCATEIKLLDVATDNAKQTFSFR
jgi:hypothetical protein